jgi:Ca2+-binding RTX toxin-like protein
MNDGSPPPNEAVYYGAFRYGFFSPEGATAADKLGVISGTLTGYDFYHDQVLRAHITGLNFDIVTALVYADLARTSPSLGTELLSILMEGDDNVTGSYFNDRLAGFDGNDTIDGGRRQDTLLGGSGADSLNGGLGADVLVGGTGRDTSTGGGGSDTFKFASAAQLKNDVITDFHKSEGDQIDVAGLGLTFIGTGAFTGADQLRVDQVSGNTIVEINVNADLAADATLKLTGLVNLLITDFILT